MSSLASMNDYDLERSLKGLVQKERRLMHLILEHIREIDSRKLYAERSYSSMYEYLTQELGYSNSAAMRRLDAARLMSVVPTLANRIQEGSIHLSQIGELTRAIKEKEKSGAKLSSSDKTELVEQIAGLNVAQTQKIIATALDIELKDPESVKIQKDDSVHLSITLTPEQYELLTNCKEKAAYNLQLGAGDHSWAKVIEIVAGQYLDGKSFSSKVFSSSSQKKTSTEETKSGVVNPGNKTLSLKTRRYILRRDICCQYQDAHTGKRCGSTYGLQIDHIIPRWQGGTHAPENLQVLCGSHNRLKYRREAGIQLRSDSSKRRPCET